MRKLLTLILTAVGLSSGCSKTNDTLSPKEFTEEFVQELQKTRPDIQVKKLRDLELNVSSDSKDNQVFLHNAYDAYKLDPTLKAKAVVLEKYIVACLETLQETDELLDESLIIPVIKDRLWLEETRQALLDRGAKNPPEIVIENFNSELIIVYAEDSPKNIRYFSQSDLQKSKIDKANLRTLACDNLKRLLPKIERHGDDGFYMITAGGDYEACLLLLDSIWSDGQFPVQGEIVVAIPCRDLLLVTGSQDPTGLEKIKKLANESWENGSYRLTPKLFVYRDGKFLDFKEPANEPLK